MPSELQGVAQALVECLNQVPQLVEYLQRLGQRCRDYAGYLADISNHPAARNAALELDMAARCCDDAAHLLSLTPLQAKAWAMQLVGGERTAGVPPVPGPASVRRDALTGSTAQAEGPWDDDRAEPEDNAAAAGNEANPVDEPASPPRISDEEGRRLQRKLPMREKTPLQRPKTRGLWVDKNGREHELTSGETDFYEHTKQFLTERSIGDDRGKLMVASHVEAKFAMFMRLNKLKHEAIVVNQSPCEGKWGCETILGYILPPGATLTVFGPDNFKRTYPLPPDERTDPT